MPWYGGTAARRTGAAALRRPGLTLAAPAPRYAPGVRRNLHCAALATALLALLALATPAAAAEQHDGGEGLWGETSDKVITNAGFLLMIFFVLFIFTMSMIQWRLDKRKDERKRAEKARRARADARGGW